MDNVAVIDVDTHVIEPVDLWSSRMPISRGDRIPTVRFDEETGEDAWFIADRRIMGAAASAHAGWREYPPSHPPRLSETDPATWDSASRLERMDHDGIYAQLLYPNMALFNTDELRGVADETLQYEYLRAYNDFLTDYCAVAPDRFIAIAAVPFWNIDLAIAEMHRCYDSGHRGMIFTQNPSAFGLPSLTDRHWDRLWAAAQEAGLPVNFHIGSGGNPRKAQTFNPQNGERANYAAMTVGLFLSNANTITQLIMGGICHRFPALNFVMVESGIGWIPFTLDSLDWQWQQCGLTREHPEYDLLPSEYFRRQVYGSFWFEKDALAYTIDRIGPANIMFETDFPHPTSMSPGPASAAVVPRNYIAAAIAGVSATDARQILHDNAARIYRLE